MLYNCFEQKSIWDTKMAGLEFSSWLVEVVWGKCASLHSHNLPFTNGYLQKWQCTMLKTKKSTQTGFRNMTVCNKCQNVMICWEFPSCIIYVFTLVALGKRREAWVHVGEFVSLFDSAAAGWADDPQSEIPTEECRTQCYSQNEDCSKGKHKNCHSSP